MRFQNGGVPLTSRSIQFAVTRLCILTAPLATQHTGTLISILLLSLDEITQKNVWLSNLSLSRKNGQRERNPQVPKTPSTSYIT